MSYTATDRRRVIDSQYRREYALKVYRGVPTSPMPSDEAGAHIRAMYDLGWSYDALEAMTGGRVSNSQLANIANGVFPTAHRATVAAILSVPYTLAPSDNVPNTCLIPTLGAQRRVLALMRLGWRHSDMERIGGIDTAHFARATYPTTTARKWRLIANLYDELQMKLGPSSKTAAAARTRRLAPPLAWNNIDDPNETPVRNPHENARGLDVIDRAVVSRLLAGERVPTSTKAEKEEAMRRWLEQGRPARQLARMHGWNDGRYNPRQEPAA